MKTFTFLLACLISLATIAQKTEANHFVILFSGEKISGTRLIYDSPIMKASQFMLDDRPFESSSVAFFQNNHGYFANLSGLHGQKAERYAMRIKSGKVNLFEEVEMEVYGSDKLGGDGTDEQALYKGDALASGEAFQYYSIAAREVKKATVRNMKVDLADNPAALREVKMIRKYQVLQVSLLAAAAGIIGNSIYQQGGGAVRFEPMMALGIIVGGSSLFLENAKENAKWLAVDNYNK